MGEGDYFIDDARGRLWHFVRQILVYLITFFPDASGSSTMNDCNGEDNTSIQVLIDELDESLLVTWVYLIYHLVVFLVIMWIYQQMSYSFCYTRGD